MKNKLNLILKPTLSILDYEMLNSFFIQRESCENSESNYRIFLLKLAQGLVRDCIDDETERENSSSRNICFECKMDGKRDSRTRIICIKCPALRAVRLIPKLSLKIVFKIFSSSTMDL